jgi:hypothetical protein
LKRNGLINLKTEESFKEIKVESKLKEQEIGNQSSSKEDFNFFDFNDSRFYALEEFFTSGKEFFRGFFKKIIQKI